MDFFGIKDFGMNFKDRIGPAIPFEETDVEITLTFKVADSRARSSCSHLRDKSSYAFTLFPVIWLVGKLSRKKRLIHIAPSEVGEEVCHCLADKYPDIFAHPHRVR